MKGQSSLRSFRSIRPVASRQPHPLLHRQLHTSAPNQLLATSSSASPSAQASPSASTSTSGFTTINSLEIQHFSKLSSQWWNPTGEFKLLHRMNPPRVEYVRQKVALDPRDEPEWTFENRHADREREELRGGGSWLAGKRVLDVGCGGGLLSESLARLGGDVLGIDASESNIAIASLHASQDPFLPFEAPVTPSTASSSSTSSSWFGNSVSTSAEAPESNGPRKQGRLQYRHTSAETLRDEGEKFDVVCGMEVLEHVDNPGGFMKCLGDMVKPGGHLILSTISRTPLSQLLTLTLAEDVLRLVTPGTHTYSKFVRPAELRRFVHQEMGGFHTWHENSNASDVRTDEVGETRGIVYDPLVGSWRLWEGAEGTWGKGLGELCNYMFHAKKRG